jgi:hypothetical protein
MANEPTKTTKEALAETPALETAEFEQTLDEFCAQLSSGDRRVELIGGYHATERAAGRIKDLPSAYAARFTSFVTAPVA